MSKKAQHQSQATTAVVEAPKAADLSHYAVLSTSPQRLQEVISANIGADGIGLFDLPRVKIPAGGGRSWELDDGAGGVEAVPVLEGVIAAFRDVRSYWARPMEESGGAPPDCTSQDGVLGIGNPGGACERCALAQWGSSSRGSGRGQACAKNRLLFLVREGEIFPTVVKVPPSSLHAVQAAFSRQASRLKKYSEVLWQISLESQNNADGIKFSTLRLKAVADLDEADAGIIAEYTRSLMPSMERAAASEAPPPPTPPPAPEAADDEIPF